MWTARRQRGLTGLRLVACSVVLVAPAAIAQAPSACPPCPCALSSASSSAAPPPAEADRLERAKTLFFQGNELRKSGDCERAALKYAESREILPTVANTLNGAWCLEQTGRFDESLELYEELLTVFRDKLDDQQRAAIAPAMATLRKQVGTLEVSSNVAGTLVIDGRTRGRLPVPSVRLLPGRHNLRVRAEGFETFEKNIVVQAGKTESIDAALKPLAQGGKLRIEAPAEAEGADLFIDGAQVGKVPWEGTLPPGSHVYALKKGDRGTAPRTARVVLNQTVTETAALKPNVAEVQITTEPLTATIAIDGVVLGNGRWIGWLPAGQYTVESSEQGYATEQRTVDAAGAPLRIPIALRIDERHPIWDARRVEMAARMSNVRTGDEMSFLYLVAAGYGGGTGIWIDFQTQTDSIRWQVIPPLLLAGVAPAGVYTLDNIGKPLKYGVPQSIAEGILIGAEEGAALAWWYYARSGKGTEPSNATMSSYIWGSASVGAVTGGLLGSLLGATPGRASFVGSTALWGGLTFGLTTGAIAPDNNERDDRIALASAVGFGAGTLGGVLVAGPVSPSAARVRLTDLAALGGGVAAAGGYLIFSDTEFEAKTTLGLTSVGILGGYAIGWYMTRNMAPDRPGAASASNARLFPQVIPTQGGMMMGIAGAL